MNKDTFYTLIKNNSALDSATQQELKAIINEYPYFQTARLLYTLNLLSADQELFKQELPKMALFCSDRIKLFYSVHEEEYAMFIQELRAVSHDPDRTMELLDSFLATMSQPEETILPEAPIEHLASIDYLAYIDSIGSTTETTETETAHLKHHNIIDNFIEKAANEEVFVPKKEKEYVVPQVAETDDSSDAFLSETLMRVYIKQKKYEQALTIIKRLSLNFPQKNAYFADQIRFLELLIQNEKNKNKQK